MSAKILQCGFWAEKKKKRPIKTTFLETVEKEPFCFGIAGLPDDFGWTEERPKDRDDFFEPNRQVGTQLNGDELPVEIFLALHSPALELLLQSINETGSELVRKKKMRSFKTVSAAEILRFHAILIYSQAVKVSRWDSYWCKKSVLFNSFMSEQMSFKRFKQIKRCVRCYIPSKVNGSDDPNSPNYDPLYKITPMQNVLLNSYRKLRVPRREVTVDEQMIKYKVDNIPFHVQNL